MDGFRAETNCSQKKTKTDEFRQVMMKILQLLVLLLPIQYYYLTLVASLPTLCHAFTLQIGSPTQWSSSSSVSSSLIKSRIVDTVDTEQTTTTTVTTTTTTTNPHDILSSFQPNPFQPWITNSHIQTIAGAYFRKELAYIPRIFRNQPPPPSKDSFVWDMRERIDTWDGDWFHVDHKRHPSTTGPPRDVVILLHGLEANSESKLTMDMAQAYYNIGMDVTCLNFRGCSGEPNDTWISYHLGFVQDLEYYLYQTFLVKQQQQEPSTIPRIYLSGFSLGANVMLLALGRWGSEKALYPGNVATTPATTTTSFSSSSSLRNLIHGATAFCVPLHNQAYQSMLRPGMNRDVYGRNLLTKLQDRTRQQYERQCGQLPPTLSQEQYIQGITAKTLYDFENAIIAPIYGFQSTEDYYEKTSCVQYLSNITVPTMIWNAQDDPFFLSQDKTDDDISSTLQHFSSLVGTAPVKIVLSKHGGHCGFIFHHSTTTTEEQSAPTTSWASQEMARFLQHVRDNVGSKE